MSDDSSVPLGSAAAPRALSWKRPIGCAAGAVAGAATTLLAMSADPGLPGGLLLGAGGTLVAAASLIGLVSSWRAASPSRELSLRAVGGPLAHAVAAAAWLWVLLWLAVAGVLPAQTWLLAVAVPVGFLWLTGALATAAARLGFLSEPERPLWRRHGFWLLALTALLQLPRLGSFGLIDPWETHYGEVAREMLARDDWISLWWAQDGWFWSKPILNFWAQGLSFLAFGVEWAPDEMITGVAQGLTPQPEWAARAPMFLLAIAGQHLLYLGARAHAGRWAAFWGVFVLATAPYWYFLTRQSMADMAYVGPMCAALGCVLLALQAPGEARVEEVALRVGRWRWTLSGHTLLFAALLALVLPQILYLVSRNVSLQWGEALRLHLHLDQVAFGSPGNCGLPGNQACRPDPAASGQALQPAESALIWAGCAGLLLWLRRGERRTKQLYYLAAWLWVAVSFMGKGAPGIVLVLAIFGAFVLARGRLAELASADLLGLGLTLGCVALPWFVQEWLRHGSPFVERLFIHDMYKRAFSHVHDTNKGDDTSFRYYVWQLGYGLFPWTGLCAAGVLHCLGKAIERPRQPGAAPGTSVVDLTWFCLLWLLAAFGMFSITGTKYHHYVLPLVPAAALLTGMWLDTALRRREAGGLSLGLAAVALAASVFVGLAGRDLAVSRPGDVEGAARLLHLFTYNYARSWPKTLDYSTVLWVFTAAAAGLCLIMMWRRLRPAALLAFASVAVAAAAWAIDVYLVETAPHWGQRETIATYYERRGGPGEPLIAYQLNWKGENFYTGNKVPAFVSSGKRFTEWVSSQRKEGVQVMFFTTEHSRVGSLQRELGSVEKFELITTPALNDKFVLARAEL